MPKNKQKPEVLWEGQDGTWHMLSYGKRFIFDNLKPGWIIDPEADRNRIRAMALRQKNKGLE